MIQIYYTDNHKILYTWRQLHCRDVCKILLWYIAHILNNSSPNFDRISNSIEIPLMGREPGHYLIQRCRAIESNKLQWIVIRNSKL